MKFPLCATIAACLVSHAMGLTPSALRCENRVDPLGIEAARPRLSWQLQAAPGETNKVQSAWQILVASSAASLSANTGDLWDSGKVVSSESKAIRYAGPALSSVQAVHWKVRVWDEADQPTTWSGPASWTTGLLDPTDWSGASWRSEEHTS